MSSNTQPSPSNPGAAAPLSGIVALADQLTRLAALQGHALPVHRFADLLTGRGSCTGSALASMVCAAWIDSIDGATASGLVALPAPQDLPCLWLSRDGEASRLVRGIGSDGRLVVSDRAEPAEPIDHALLEAGSFLQLRAPTTSLRSGADSSPALKLFLGAIVKRRAVFAEAIGATLLVSAIGLMVSIYTMQVYDRVVPNQGYATLWVLTIGVVIAILFDFALKWVRSATVDHACKAIDQELSAVFFGHMLAVRLDARPRTVGTLAAQIRQFETVRNFLTSTTLFVLAEAPFAFLFIAVIAAIAGPLALIPLGFLPLVVVSAMMFWRPLQRLTLAQTGDANISNGLLVEAIDGIESIKAANAEWKLLDRWNQLARSVAQRELRIRAISGLSTNLGGTLQQLSYIALVAAGVVAIGSGNLTQGALIACTIIAGRALGPLAQVPAVLVQWQHAKAALTALDQLLALPSDAPAEVQAIVPARCTGQLALEGVVFAYAADTPAIEVPQCRMNPGERIAILGASGAGKSTLLKLLSGLYRPNTGRLLLDGVDASLLAPGFVREHIAYLPQDVRLFAGTLRDNLCLGLPLPDDSQIMAAAVATGLDRVIGRHPRGLSLPISEGGKGLSGGQRQLVGVTRLLLARPSVLLLDEPTASLDAELEAALMRATFDARRPDDLVVLVTHKLSLLQHVSRVIFMARGRIVLDGPRDQVLERLRKPGQTDTSAVLNPGLRPRPEILEPV